MIECFGDEFRGDGGGDDVEGGVGVHVGGGAVARFDIVDEAFIERPGVYLAFPVIDDGIAEAEGFALLVADGGGESCGAGGGEGFI